MPAINETLKKDIGKDGIVDADVIEKNDVKNPDTPPDTKSGKSKKDESEKSDEEKIKYVRPPMEQLAKDFEKNICTLEIDNKKITKLGYKCGKIIWGLQSNEGKDFRVIAFKARKKTRSVERKSLTSGKMAKRVVIIYSDDTFKEFLPGVD